MEFLHDVVENILARLPIKDIFRFKLVCKSWFTLISSSGPYFTSNYVRNSPFTLILRAQGDYTNKLSISLLEFEDKGGEYTNIPIIMTLKLPDHASGFSSSFIGSYDCSVFILQHKRIADYHVINRVYMLNPVLGSCVKVTDDTFRECEQKNYEVGFIPSNNTYKLVRFYPGLRNAENPEIFTVGMDKSWRIVDDPLLFCGANFFGQVIICFNGVFHWLSSSEYDDDDDDDDRIFTFHLLEEKRGIGIPKPHGVSRLSRMTILNDLLSVADFSDEYATMVIWSMGEYGVVESWSKVFVLPLCFDQHPEKWRYHDYLVPIAVLANGDILFEDKSCYGGMWFYDLQEKQLTHHPDSPNLYRRLENTYVPRFST